MSGYRNRFEARVGATMDPAYLYEAHRMPYTTVHHYTPDFVDVANKRLVETKGFFPASDRAKMLAVCRQYPDWQIEIVFQNAQKTISKSSSTTYGDWCTKHNIAWRQA